MLLTSKFAGEKLTPSMAVLDSCTEAPDASKEPDWTVSEALRSDDIPVGVSISAKLLNEGSPSTANKVPS